MKRTPGLYFKLFFSVFTLSALTVGGGYVIVPLMQREFVTKLKWISEEEMLDLAAIAQSSPGAMAVNSAVLVGYRVGGFLGAFIAVVGSVIPPLVTIILISLAYTAFRENRIAAALLAGLKIGAAAVIIDVVVTMAAAVIKEKSVLSALVLLVSFLLVYFAQINVIFVILGCIALGVFVALMKRRTAKKRGESE